MFLASSTKEIILITSLFDEVDRKILLFKILFNLVENI